MNGALEKQKSGVKCLLLVNGVLLTLLAYFAWTTVYSSDDYWYSTFWDQGLMHYLELMEYHYREVNGRMLVHVLAHIVLHFSSWAYVVMCCGLCVLGSWIVADASGDRPGRFHVVLCMMLIGIFCMPLGIFNQGLMWISASCNYLFPVILICGLTVLLEHRSRWAVLLAFLSGATTEQMGLAAVALCGFYLIRGVLNGNGIRHSVGCLAMSMTGVLTIFLSPATQNRTENSLSWDGLQEFFEILFRSILWEGRLLTENPAPVLIMVLVMVMGARLLWQKQGMKWPAVLSALGSTTLVLGSIASDDVCIFGFVSGFLALAVLGMVLMRGGGAIAGSLILTALASAIVVLPTSTIEHRVMMPVYLLFLLACCSLVALQVQRIKSFGFFSLAALIAVLVVTAPTVQGYWYNHQIDEINKTHVREDAEKDYIRYCIDYNDDYTWIKADRGPTFQAKYLESIGLTETFPIRFYSRHIQSNPIWYGNTELVRLAIVEDNGLVMFPLREMVEVVGGTLDWEQEQMIVQIQGKTYELRVPDQDTVIVTWSDETGTTQESQGSRVLRNWNTYCDISVFTQAFGFRLWLDEENGYYIVEQ